MRITNSEVPQEATLKTPTRNEPRLGWTAEATLNELQRLALLVQDVGGADDTLDLGPWTYIDHASRMIEVASGGFHSHGGTPKWMVFNGKTY